MAGHSKWKGIKHKKALVDAQRGKAFTKVIREVTAAARLGGGSPEANPRLRLAIQKAKEANLPKDSLEKAIQRGTGELPGAIYEETTIEGYGPGGVAILVEGITDNRNRTSAEFRSIFLKYGGNMAGAGSVAWLFHKKGQVVVKAQGLDEEKLMDAALGAGAEDMQMADGGAVVIAPPHAFEAVKQAVQAGGFTIDTAEITAIPTTTVRVEDPGQAKTLLALLDALDEHDDAQHVYANFDIPEAVLADQAGA